VSRGFFVQTNYKVYHLQNPIHDQALKELSGVASYRWDTAAHPRRINERSAIYCIEKTHGVHVD